MKDRNQSERVREVWRLLETAGADEQTAITGLHGLIDRHGTAEIRAAITVVATEYLGDADARVFCTTAAPGA